MIIDVTARNTCVLVMVPAHKLQNSRVKQDLQWVQLKQPHEFINNYQHLFSSSSHKNYLENDDFLKKLQLLLHKQLCLGYHSKHLQSSGNTKEEIWESNKLWVFCKIWTEKLVRYSWCLGMQVASIPWKHYWAVIIKIFSLFCSPRSWKFVPQLFLQPHKPDYA